MRATIAQWLEFRSSYIWADMQDDLKAELQSLQVELEDETQTLDRLRWLQGRVTAIRHFLDLPDFVIRDLDSAKTKQEEQDETRDE